MKTSIRLLAFALTVGGAGFAARTLAQEPPTHPRPCAADAQRLCKGVPFGTGEVMQCLKSHKSELSPECKLHVLQAAEKKQKQDMEHEKSGEPAPVPPG